MLKSRIREVVISQYLLLPMLAASVLMFMQCRVISRWHIVPLLTSFGGRFNPLIFDGGKMDCAALDFIRTARLYEYDEAYYKRMRNAWLPERQLAEEALCNGCFKVLPPQYVFEWQDKCAKESPDIFFLIKTAFGNFDRRQAVRHTWLRNFVTATQPNRFKYLFVASFSEEILRDQETMKELTRIKQNCKNKDCSKQPVELAEYQRTFEQFVESFGETLSGIGKLTPKQTFTLQIGEALKYGDVIISDNFGDSYLNLTHKLLSGFQWMRKYCPNARFVVPVDDDIFVFVDRLLKLLERYASRPLYLGGNRMFGEPNRQIGSKWYISPKKFKYNRTPDYYNGPIFVAGNDSIEALLRVMPNLRVNDLGVQLDDFIVTGFARALAGIDDDHLCYFPIGAQSWRRFRHHEIEPWVVAVLSSPSNNHHLHRAILADGEPFRDLSLKQPDRVYRYLTAGWIIDY